ncbi:HAD family hydrolase [Oscillatoria sp. CS-180]|uniref:HAD family hydrolase n=1 Tax=Oscillatoria sp. CS-180 TaxID=3021720 RepID=UPI00232FEB98|nr:HAD family hydrolase [Oscillatoria sp. CS-180]MDB9527093.1 HAD family hydrolase [Oscillatoria sp. CS-180]
MLRILTDFDGPIMDVSERYYQVYQYCLEEAKEPQQSVNRLSKQDFWRLKRSQVPERQIGLISGLHDDQARQFALLRRETVHSRSYLKYDLPIEGASEALRKIQALDGHLVVVTMRREYALDFALSQYDLEHFFPLNVRYCLPDDYLKDQDIVEKTRLVKKALAELPPACETWMVGDTEADIAAARAHDLPVVAVLSGIRDRDRLTTYSPDYIVANLQEAVVTISNRQAG